MNVAMDDHALLQDYARRQSHDAFRHLVDRHLRMVYGTAHRIVRDVHLAEEVAQNVFTLLAKKAAEIVPPQVVAGWLYNSTRHLAMHCVRSEQRRREREETAAAMHMNQSEADPAWVSEHLEEALSGLEASERDALVLRFLEERSLRQVGVELGVSEDAARMRVNRAVEQIRIVFQRRGTSVTAVGLAAVLPTVSSIPSTALAATVTATGMVAVSSLGVTNGFAAAGFMNLKALGLAAALATATAVATYLWQAETIKASEARLADQSQLVAGLEGDIARLRQADMDQRRTIDRLKLAASESELLRKRIAMMIEDSKTKADLQGFGAPLALSAGLSISGARKSWLRLDEIQDRGASTPEDAVLTYYWALWNAKQDSYLRIVSEADRNRIEASPMASGWFAAYSNTHKTNISQIFLNDVFYLGTQFCDVQIEESKSSGQVKTIWLSLKVEGDRWTVVGSPRVSRTIQVFEVGKRNPAAAGPKNE